jgi:hypothetical protein
MWSTRAKTHTVLSSMFASKSRHTYYAAVATQFFCSEKNHEKVHRATRLFFYAHVL